jgi:hypothetical protein
MTDKLAIYKISPGQERGAVSVEQVYAPADAGPLTGTYSHMFVLGSDETPTLLAVESGRSVSAFSFSPSNPFLRAVESAIDLGGSWDLIEPFVLGNTGHLLAYRADPGEFSFIPLDEQLASLPSYRFARRRNPGATAGFSVAQPIAIGGLLYYLCYSFEHGDVKIFSLAVTASTEEGSAPLLSLPVWDHTWARQWTRFAFFTLGGGNFFLKTNVGRLNVNIDHVLDTPSQGTVEIGSYLKLEDALELDLVRAFYLDRSSPYFVTYIKNGKTTVNRFHGDCLGWTTEATLDTVAGATQLVPVPEGEDCFLIFR